MSKHLIKPVEMSVSGCPFSPLLDVFGVPPIPIRTSGYMNCYKDCLAGGGLIRLKLLSRIPSPVREATPTHWVATQLPPYCWARRNQWGWVGPLGLAYRRMGTGMECFCTG